MPSFPDDARLSRAGHPQPAQRTTGTAERVFWLLLIAGLLMAGLYLKQSPWNLALLTRLQEANSLPPVLWMGVTVLGTGWAAVLLVSVVDRHAGLCSVAAFGALLMGGALVTGVKRWIPSPRPLSVLGEQSMTVMGQHLTGINSMPSGHALTAMAAVTVMVLFLRARVPDASHVAWLLLVPGLLIACSRVVVGAHWPADVCVGAALGITTGIVCWQFSLWCQRRWGAISPKLPIVFELLVLCYAPFEKNGYPEVDALLRAVMVLAGFSIALRLYRLSAAGANRVRGG